VGKAKPKMAESLRRIRTILQKEWDPIGVQHTPGAEHEYDMYAPRVYALLRGNCSAKAISEHLHQIEIKRMGLQGSNAEHLSQVAESLLAIPVAEDEPYE